MIICDSRRFLFVHVQKTGGTTMTRLLKAQLDDTEVRSIAHRHAPLRKILRAEPGLTDYWIFGFARDPWDRMVSWWNMIDDWHRRSIDPTKRPGEGNAFWKAAASYGDFEEFILRGTEELPRLRRTQTDFLSAGNRRADFIGRTETLTDDSRYAMQHFGLTIEPLGHHNRGNRSESKYRHYYNDRTRARVTEIFAKDITEFDYTF